MGSYNVNIHNGKIQFNYLQWKYPMYLFMGRSDVDIYKYLKYIFVEDEIPERGL